MVAIRPKRSFFRFIAVVASLRWPESFLPYPSELVGPGEERELEDLGLQTAPRHQQHHDPPKELLDLDGNIKNNEAFRLTSSPFRPSRLGRSMPAKRHRP